MIPVIRLEYRVKVGDIIEQFALEKLVVVAALSVLTQTKQTNSNEFQSKFWTDKPRLPTDGIQTVLDECLS
jgi:hypothetical protein